MGVAFHFFFEVLVFIWSLFSQKTASGDYKSPQHHRRKPRETGTYSKSPCITKTRGTHSSPVTPTSRKSVNARFTDFFHARFSRLSIVCPLPCFAAFFRSFVPRSACGRNFDLSLAPAWVCGFFLFEVEDVGDDLAGPGISVLKGMQIYVGRCRNGRMA